MRNNIKGAKAECRNALYRRFQRLADPSECRQLIDADAAAAESFIGDASAR